MKKLHAPWRKLRSRSQWENNYTWKIWTAFTLDCHLQHHWTLALPTVELLSKVAFSKSQWQQIFCSLFLGSCQKKQSSSIKVVSATAKGQQAWNGRCCVCLQCPACCSFTKLIQNGFSTDPNEFSLCSSILTASFGTSIMECVLYWKESKVWGTQTALLASQLSLLEQWWKQVGQRKKKEKTLIDDADKCVSTLTLTSGVSPVAYILPRSLMPEI